MNHVKTTAVFSILLCASGVASAQLQVRKQVLAAARPPDSALPRANTQQSTALAAAARTGVEPLKELPGFSLVDADGKTIDLRALAKTSRWLMLYRQARCASCDSLMASLEQNAAFQHGSAITVVVAGASAVTLGKTQAQFPQWTGAMWTADTAGSAFTALQMRGTPMLYGLSGTRIVFAFAGAPGGAQQVSSAASSWIAAAQNEPVATASAGSSGVNP